MFAIILIVLGLFYLGGDAQGADVIAGVDPEMWQPANTNALLMLIYGLFGLAVAATVVAAVFQFGAALKDSPANAIKSLLGLVLLVVVLVIAWAAGDGTPMNIPKMVSIMMMLWNCAFTTIPFPARINNKDAKMKVPPIRHPNIEFCFKNSSLFFSI